MEARHCRRFLRESSPHSVCMPAFAAIQSLPRNCTPPGKPSPLLTLSASLLLYFCPLASSTE